MLTHFFYEDYDYSFWFIFMIKEFKSILYTRVAQKNWKFYDSELTMGKIIIKWFYSYYFWFYQPYAPAMPKTQKYVVRACAYFFLWSAVNK